MALDHTAVYGATQTGKTTKMRRLSFTSRQRLIIYDPTAAGPIDESGWRPCLGGWLSDKKTHATTNAITAMDLCGGYTNCDVFIDEAADCLSQKHGDNWWLLTKGRHLGHQVFFASQRPLMVAPSVRAQASSIYIYRLARDDLRQVLSDAGISIKGVPEKYFPRNAGEYLHADLRTAKLHYIKEMQNGTVAFKEEIEWRVI